MRIRSAVFTGTCSRRPSRRVGVAALILAPALTAIALLAPAASAAGSFVGSITLAPIATTFNSPVGIDYHEPSGKLLLSVNYPSGSPHNFDLVDATGANSQFGGVSGLGDEVYISTVRSSSCQGGFTVGDSFVGTGNPGEVLRLDSSGASYPFVTLPSEPGLLRGGLFQDRHCAFGGDLIVTTTAGNVWRVTSTGVPTLVASHVGNELEGPTTVPVDVSRYGPWSGTILATDEVNNRVISVDAAGNATSWYFGHNAEGVHVIPAAEDFYGVNFAAGQIVRADASQFTSITGDILLANEDGVLQHIYWDGSAFRSENVAQIAQFEGSTFAPVSVPLAEEQPITVASSPISAVEGAAFTGNVATVSDPDTASTAAEYTATIDWGDASTSTGTVSGSGGSFTVAGTHTYLDEGSYAVTVTVDDVDDAANSATATTTATVADADITATCATPTLSTQAFSGTTASLSDANTLGTAADFTATIDWGDTSTSAGTVTGSAGSYTVSGSHTYSSTGYFTVTTSITDDGGKTTSAACTVLVYAFAPGGGAFVVGDKSATGSVTFWGAQWWRLNSLTGGAAPAAFKGFAKVPATPTCGAGWTTQTGNSTPPPAAPLPAYMGVIVSSAVTQSGAVISGNTPSIVVVATNPGYDGNPGHAGTGKVVATVCP
jgi:hypothetical protein